MKYCTPATIPWQLCHNSRGGKKLQYSGYRGCTVHSAVYSTKSQQFSVHCALCSAQCTSVLLTYYCTSKLPAPVLLYQSSCSTGPVPLHPCTLVGVDNAHCDRTNNTHIAAYNLTLLVLCSDGGNLAQPLKGCLSSGIGEVFIN